MKLGPTKPKLLYSVGNGAISHLPTEMGNTPLLLAELMMLYSLTTKIVKFDLHMKNCKLGRKYMFIR